jgi:hypothetical protein
MPVGACGMSCDVCALNIKGICGTCVAGTDERARKKLDAQMQLVNEQCSILACAVDRKVGYCLKDCEEFPCAIFESGAASVLGPGPFPYSSSFLTMFRRRLRKKR